MNRKVLVLAVATAFAAPMAATADVKLSGNIQGEYNYAEVGNYDRESYTNDGVGAGFNGGPNHIRLDFEESLGGGLKAYGRYTAAFSTFANKGLVSGQETYVGLKGSVAYFRLGKMTGAYKASKGLVDPWAGTSLQARGTGGGMTGSTYLAPVALKDCSGCAYGPLKDQIDSLKADPSINAGEYLVTSKQTHSPYGAFTHSSYVENVVEIGAKFGGFSASLQGVVDKGTGMDGAGLVELKYSAENFTIFAAGAYTDLTNNITNVTNDITSSDEADEDDGFSNWKIGAQAKFAGLKLGLQFEDAEMGTMTGGQGQYILGSVDYGINNVSLAAWVASYSDDDLEEDDALSFAIGAKYKFSKRTMAYVGYRQTDSDNDYRDENVFTLGVRHSF
ncbi:porin [Candidatus Albibeggiatoa sp. nov. BB20]|uniref:porin n=1 Tax=Candidatus Albibeggiatoa sp. nov. BB20 TaxID=3162723 RepID=UPI00336551ED